MRRDYFTLDVRNVEAADGEDRPTVVIGFGGPDDQLLDRLTDGEGNPLDAGEVDVAYRLQTAVDDEDAAGVVAVTNRVTGEFILEMNAAADDVFEFLHAARTYGKESEAPERYRIVVTIDDEEVATYDKTTFLVYDDEGGLLREHSLIPNNVEL